MPGGIPSSPSPSIEQQRANLERLKANRPDIGRLQTKIIPNENTLQNSSVNSPAAALERNNLELVNKKYPLDLGTNYSNIMRIFIYQQKKTNPEYLKNAVVSGDSFKFNQQAGATKATKVDAAWAAGTIGGVKTAIKGAEALAGETATGISQTGEAALATGASTYLASNLDTARKTKQACAYISLFMPDTIIVNDRHDFDAVSVTEALGNAGVLQAGGSAAADIIKAGSFSGAPTGSATMAEVSAMAAKGAGIVGDRILDVNLFSMGYALNPQLEILYKGSKQREFQFQFRFAPRSQDEMKELEDIIRTLRFHAAPEYDTSNKSQSRYFIPPSEFEVDFYIGEGDNNKHLPRIGQCVLTNIDVNYAPQGHYASFKDGAPVEVQLQLSFIETIVLTKADILIGY